MTNEYSKIHALARARKLVMDKFGTDLLNFWPLADDTVFIRDLLRQKSLAGSGVSIQQPGMLDYAVDLTTGHISDVVADINPSYSGQGAYNEWKAVKMPAGAWREVEFPSAYVNVSNVQAFVAPPDLSPTDVPSKAVATGQVDSPGGSTYKFTFPFPIYALADMYWIYLRHWGGGGRFDLYHGGTEGLDAQQWTGSAWSAITDKLRVILRGVNAEAWASYDKFTIGALVNVDNSPCDGVVVAISDASEIKARLYVKSDKKVEGKFKNTNGTLYTVTAAKVLHLGYNLLTLSYEKNVANGVKLGVNGVVVAQATPNNYPLFNTTLALGIGAQMLTGKTTSDQLKNALVDDVYLAKGVVTDAVLRNIFEAYILSVPLMQMEESFDLTEA